MKINYFIPILTVFISFGVFAQPKYIKEAQKSFNQEDYFVAVEKCSDAYKKLGAKKSQSKLKAEMGFLIAESYRHIEQYVLANDWYGKLIELGYDKTNPEIYYRKGEMLRMMKECDRALKYFKEYKKIVPKDTRVDISIKSCNDARKFKKNRKRYVIKNVSGLNKRQMDMAPMIGSAKKNVMYFASTRKGSTGDDIDPITGESYMDLWKSILDKKGNWGEPMSVDKKNVVNTDQNEGTVCFDERYKKMLFTRCPNAEKQYLGCDIWIATYSKKKWVKPQKLNLKTSDTISVGHPCYIKGETKYDFKLIFASDRDGGFGGRDLWLAEVKYDKKKKQWLVEKITNMGANVNTKSNELFPTLGSNNELFFASDGHVGLGGLDIFMIEKTEGKNEWTSEPLNMGLPINSQNNDYALCDIDGVTGYFTSERKSSNGEFSADIYQYKLPPNLFSLTVTVREYGTNKRIEDADVNLICSSDSKNFAAVKTNKTGKVNWEKMPNGDRVILQDKEYQISTVKEGYSSMKSRDITTVGKKKSQKFNIDLYLLPEKEIKLTEVQYVRNQWNFIHDSTCMSLDSLTQTYNMLKDFPRVKIKIFSHTDARGSDEKNRTLSENRARKYYTELIKMGIDPRRIIPQGKGETQPRVWYDPQLKQTVTLDEAYINQFKSSDPVRYEYLHQLNRRTTAKVIDKNWNKKTAPPAPSNEENKYFDKYLDY